MKIDQYRWLGLIITIVLLIIGLTFITKGFNKSSKTNISSNSQQFGNGPKIAVRQGGNFNQSGDIWIMNADGTQKVQLTHTGNIDKLHGWSPDNKYIATTLLLQPAIGRTASKNSLAVVETVIELYKLPDGPSRINMVWNGNNELIVLPEDGMYRVAIPSGMITTILKTYKDIDPHPNEQFTYHSSISPNNQWIALVRSTFQNEPVLLYSYNLEKKLLKKIAPSPISQEKDGGFASWRGDKMIYITGMNKKNVWEVNADGSNKQLLFKPNKNNLWSFLVSRDMNKIYFEEVAVTDEKNNDALVEYNIATKQTRKIDLSGIEVQLGKPLRSVAAVGMGDFRLSANDMYMSLSVTDREIVGYTLNLQSGKTARLCQSWCHTPVWSN